MGDRDTYRPSDVFIGPPYQDCPSCGSDRFGRLWVQAQAVVRKCAACGFSARTELPQIQKKLIYLDQFAISNMMKALDQKHPANKQARDQGWLSLFERLDRLTKLQLTVCPESPAHEIESSLHGPGFQQLQRLYETLALYEQCVVAQRRINDEHPGTLMSGGKPAGKSKGVSTSDQATFKPKSATDYVTHLPEQSTQRTRRHEALINMFGPYLSSRGIKPVTRHPIDIEGVTEDRALLFEGKVVGPNAEHAVRAAIRQLFAYRHFYFRAQGEPDPVLIGLFTEPIGEAFVDLLNSLEIGAVWRDGASWIGCPIAIDAGVVPE